MLYFSCIPYQEVFPMLPSPSFSGAALHPSRNESPITIALFAS